ncbi:MAG: fibronectin type III domain-containing protein, partial [Pedosphaera parvula]|nr:fibronectin type III domain-containing protein [Pedosphaera parvula]
STLTAPPTEILISFSANTDAATIGPGTVRLVRPGADSTFGPSDDVIVVPTALTLTTPSQLKIDLTGLALPNDGYRLTIAGTAVPPYGLLHRWRFDEGSGTAATDSISQPSTGTLSGPTWSTGKLGSALHYAGGTDTVLVGASNLAPPWTAAMWVRREDSPAVDARIMDCESFGQGGSLRLEQYSGTNQVGVTRYGSWDSTFGYLAPLATWTHLAFVCDGTKIVLYANGVSGGTIGSVVDLPRWFLGSQGANAMKGDLDDVRVYDRALSATEAGTLATLGGVARDGGGVALDGEYTGSFPSGDGSEGGDFVATFAVNVTAPTAPSNLTATTTSFTQITLQWTDASDNEEGFRIERSTNGVDFTEVATTPANTTTYTVDGLSSLTKYWFRVRA